MAKKTLKNKTYTINVSNILSTKKVSKTMLKKYVNSTLKTMVRGGEGSTTLDPFIKQSKQVFKFLETKKPSKKLTSRQINKVVNLLDFNQGQRNIKDGNINIKFSTTKFTKLTKDNTQQEVTKSTLRQLKKMGLSGRDRKIILDRLNKGGGSAPKNIYDLELKVASDSEIYNIILGMGGGDFKTALVEYPDDVKRLCNDYLGIDIDDWYLD